MVSFFNRRYSKRVLSLSKMVYKRKRVRGRTTGRSPASTRTLLLCPHPNPLPPEQKAVKCWRWEGRGLLNFELISALIRSGHLIQSAWIMQWMVFLIFVNIAPRSLWRLSITQQNIINWRQKLQKNWAKRKDLPQWKKGRTMECYLWISFPLFVMVIPIYWGSD